MLMRANDEEGEVRGGVVGVIYSLIKNFVLRSGNLEVGDEKCFLFMNGANF